VSFLGYSKLPLMLINKLSSHPVHNDYLPIQFRGDVFLREPGDLKGKVWDEDALRLWEHEMNGGKDWDGRKTQ